MQVGPLFLNQAKPDSKRERGSRSAATKYTETTEPYIFIYGNGSIYLLFLFAVHRYLKSGGRRRRCGKLSKDISRC